MKVASIRIRRGPGPTIRRIRGAAMLCLVAMLTSCVIPLAATRAPTGFSIALEAAQPFDASAGLTGMMPAEAPDAIQPQTLEFSPTVFVPGPAPSPFKSQGNAQDRLRASLCLTAAIYYEAGNEPDEGQRAVAQVVLNRVRHPAYPDTVCGVVYQGTERNDTLCQFTFGCDGSMARMPVSSVWGRARRNAQAALSGAVYAPVGLATHYHTRAVNPGWNRALTPTAIVGAHIFFRWPGGAGSPNAFYASYRGNEPIPGPKPKLFVPTVPLEMAGLPIRLPVQTPLPETVGARIASIAPSAAVSADRRYVTGSLPESDIREEYRNSGQWITR